MCITLSSVLKSSSISYEPGTKTCRSVPFFGADQFTFEGGLVFGLGKNVFLKLTILTIAIEYFPRFLHKHKTFKFMHDCFDPNLFAGYF